MRIAVVEDEKEYMNQIKGFIEKYCKENGEDVQIVTFSDGIDIASDYTADYDIIFLDIVMKHMDGLKTAEYIRKMDKKVIIVFITGNADYAIHGYSVEAFSFILKPINYFAFSEELARCIKKVKSARRKYIVFSTENGMDRIAIDKIVYIESQGHKMIINTEDKTYRIYETMRSLEDKLPKEQFSRCNNCYLINLSFVKGIHGEYVLLNNEELKISRARRKPFLEDMAAYFVSE